MNSIIFRKTIFSAVFSLLTISLTSQTVFWQKSNKIPVLSTRIVKDSIYRDAKLIQIIDTIEAKIDGFVINSKGHFLGKSSSRDDSGLKKIFKILVSKDIGKTWKDVTKNIPLSMSQAAKDMSNDPDTKYLVDQARKNLISYFALEGFFYVVNSDGFRSYTLWRTSDLGETWEKMGSNPVFQNAYFFVERGSLYIRSGNNTYSSKADYYKSIDKAKSWTYLNREDSLELGLYNLDFKPDFWNNDLTLLYKFFGSTQWYSYDEFIKLNQQSGKIVVEAFFPKYKNNLVISPSISRKFSSGKYDDPADLGFSYEFCKKNEATGKWTTVSSFELMKAPQQTFYYDCRGDMYANLTRPVLGFCRSKNGGETWEILKGLPTYPFFSSINVGEDGKLYYMFNDDLYISLEKPCCKSCEEKPQEEPNTKFGTTIITHGIMPHPPIAETYSTWVEDMANAILSKAQKGIIYLYNTENGKYQKIKSIGEKPEDGEKILIFDWHEKSLWTDTDAFAVSAAEELYLSISKLNKEGVDLDKVHFIGCDRGNFVNSLAIKSLLQLEDPATFSIDQFTIISPADFTNDFQQIQTWQSVKYTDVYVSQLKEVVSNSYLAKQAFTEALSIVAKKIDYTIKVSGNKLNLTQSLVQQLERFSSSIGPEEIEKDELYLILNELNNMVGLAAPLSEAIEKLSIIVDGLRILVLANKLYENWDAKYSTGISPSATFEWKGLNSYELCLAYINSINGPSNINGGYYLSRLSNGEGGRIMPSWQGKGGMPESFNMEKFGIYNGAFDYSSSIFVSQKNLGVPWWKIINGNYNSKNLTVEINNNGQILHDRFYIPKNSNTLSFEIMTSNVKKGNLSIDFLDINKTVIYTKTFPIDADIVSFVKKEINLLAQKLQDKVVSLSIRFKGEMYDSAKGQPKVILDNIKLIK